MNATADDIYQELIALPKSKLAEVWQFIELIKYDTQKVKPQMKTLESFAMPELFKDEPIDEMLDYIYQQRQEDKMDNYE